MAKIIVEGSKKEICGSFETADNAIARMRGLMFRSKPAFILFDFHGVGIYPIHSFFVRFNFDAIYLDPEFGVVEAFRSVKPYTALVRPKAPARYLLETPEGICEKFGIAEGSRLEIVD
ncbi:MAG: DUF192 domain-containing protein [Candidatus Micrarchaeia archaeon]